MMNRQTLRARLPLRSARPHGQRLLRFLCCAVLWVAIAVVPARGLAVQERDEGLDLLVLVDQSGSMAGRGAASGHDPTGLRFRLLELATTQLAESADHDRLRHRLAVVSFGSTARLHLPWTEVHRSELPELSRRFASLVAESDLGDTSFAAAFAAAVEQFARLSAAVERRRAILLFTDGILDEPAQALAMSSHETERSVMEALRDTGATLDVAVLCPPGCPAWKHFGAFWLNLSGGRARHLPEEEHLALAELHGMVAEQVSTQLVSAKLVAASGGEEEIIVLPPYLETVVFDFFGADSAAEVLTFPPDHPSQSLSAAIPNVEERWLGDAIRTLTIHRPAPGRWVFRKPGPEARIEIFSRQFFPRGRLVEPTKNQPLFVNQRSAFLYLIFDDRKPFQPLPSYPVTLDLSVLRPDGYRRHFMMQPASSQQPGAYRSIRESLFDLPGHYRTEVRMVTQDLGGQPVTVFEDRWAGFTVRDQARQLICELTAPASDTAVPLFGTLIFVRRPVELRLDCRHPGGPVSLEEAEAAALAIRPRLVFRGHPVEGVLRLRAVSSGGFEVGLEGSDRPGSYGLMLEVDESALPASLELELIAGRRHFLRVWSWNHYGQLGLLGLVAVLVGLSVAQFHGCDAFEKPSVGIVTWLVMGGR